MIDLRVTARIYLVFFGCFFIDQSASCANDAYPTEVVANVGYSDYVHTSAISPNKQLIAAAGSDQVVKLWAVDSGRLVRAFAGHKSQITAVVFSPDGRTIISASSDKTIKIWEVATGAIIRSINTGAEIQSLALSNDGTKLISGDSKASEGSVGNNKIRLWDVASGKMIREIANDFYGIESLIFSRDEKSVFGGTGNGLLRQWAIDNGRIIRTFEFEPTQDSYKGSVHSLSLSPDGKKLLAVNSGVVFWDVTTGQRDVGAKDKLLSEQSVAMFLPDSMRIAISNIDGKVAVWNLEKHSVETFAEIKGDPKISIANDGSVIAAVSKFEIGTFSPGFHRESHFKLHNAAASRLDLSCDGGSMIVALSNGIAKKFDLKSARATSSFAVPRQWPLVTGADRDGAVLTGGNKAPLVYTDSTTKRSEQLVPATQYRTDDADLSCDGRLVAFPSDGSLKLWSAETREATTLGKLGSVYKIEFGFDKHHLTTLEYGPGDGKTSVKLWDIDSRKLANTIVINANYAVASALSRDSTKVALVSDEGLQIWDWKAGRLSLSKRGNASFPISMPDGSFAYVAIDAFRFSLFDAQTRALKQSFQGHSAPIDFVATPWAGNIFVSSSRDGTVKLWKSSSGELLATLILQEDDEWLTITPEGFFDASSSNAGKNLSIVRGLESYSIDQFYDALHRPDLVQQKLAGDPDGLVKAAAAKLNLDKVASSGSSPHVAIKNGVSSEVADFHLTVEGTVTDQGGGIGRIELRNNNKTIDIDATSGTESNSVGRTVAIRKTVPLVIGENVIEIKAYNGQNLIESEPARIIVRRSEQPQVKVTRPQLYVLAVGINDYWDSKLHLNFAVPDARSIAVGLQQGGGKLYERVNITTVLNADVSAAKLDRVFADLKGKVQTGDVFVFFLSGHGKTQDGRFYYIPQDFRYNGPESITQNAISHDQLKAWFTQIAAQKSVLLFDACESGALIQGQIAMRGLEDKTALDHLVRATGATVLTATTDDKPAAEGYHGHGVFTYTLLSAFANADTNGDGFVDVQELASYVFTQVPLLTDAAWGIKQSPQFNVVGSIYPLVSKISLLPAEADDSAAVFPKIPTHVVIAASTVRQSASATSGAVVELSPGMQVRLIETSGGWMLVAREGKKLGYIEAKAVLGLQ
jgi:WD40 repeat protein